MKLQEPCVLLQVQKRAAANCFSSTTEEEDVFRALLFVYVYKLFVVRSHQLVSVLTTSLLVSCAPHELRIHMLLGRL